MLLPIELASFLLAAVIPLCHAQTFTDCNPLQKSCPNDPAIAANFKTSFAGASDIPQGWHRVACQGGISYGPGGVAFSVAGSGDCPTIETDGALLFGYAEVKMKAAPGQGIVSSIVLESDALDEVDWEFIGGENYRVQANYFGKADQDFHNMVYIPASDNQNTYHTYALNWTSASLTWLVDNQPIRTLQFADAKGGTRYPQTPMRLRIGNWAAGDSKSPQGTITWAGGLTDYSKGPFAMNVDSVAITNYSPGKEYKYGDMSGNWQSIQVIGGTAGGIVAPGPGSASSSVAVLSSGTAGVSAPATTVATVKTSTAAAVTSSVSASNNKAANSTTSAPAASAATSKSNSTSSTPAATTPSSTVKPAQANAASGFKATGAAVAGLSFLFLALLV